jgi:hypothetical protein
MIEVARPAGKAAGLETGGDRYRSFLSIQLQIGPQSGAQAPTSHEREGSGKPAPITASVLGWYSSN